MRKSLCAAALLCLAALFFAIEFPIAAITNTGTMGTIYDYQFTTTLTAATPAYAGGTYTSLRGGQPAQSGTIPSNGAFSASFLSGVWSITFTASNPAVQSGTTLTVNVGVGPTQDITSQLTAVTPSGTAGPAGGGAVFPPTPGVVCNTSTTASATCSPGTDYVVPTALSNYIPTTQKGAPNGVQALDANGSIPITQFPANGAFSTGAGPANLLVDYVFQDKTGTTITDISGHGNNATFGATAPTWVPNGINLGLNAFATLPAALNTAKTFAIVSYQTPISTTPGPNFAISGTRSPIISSSLGTNGVNFLNGFNYFSPVIYTGLGQTNTSMGVTGLHSYIFTLGTGGGDLDHIYIDGQEIPYNAQLASFGQQSSGNLFLGTGGGGWTGNGCFCTMYRFRAWSTELSASDVMSASNAMLAAASLEGVQIKPLPVPHYNPIVHGIGNSIMYGTGLSPLYQWASNMVITNFPAYTVLNWGLPTVRAVAVAPSEPNRVAPYCANPYGAKDLAIVELATNDLGNGASVATTMLANASEIQTLKQAGCTVAVTTLLSHGNSGDAQKNAWNPVFRTQALKAGADFIIDFATDPRLGADGAYANPAPTACGGGVCFQVDALHPALGGATIMSSIGSAAASAYYGTTAANPTIPILTSNAYTMLSGDTYVELNSTNITAASTLTLPTCIGPSGARYTINNTQAAFAITLKSPGAAYLVNGIDYSSSGLTIPANSTKTFTVVPGPTATGGCHWSSL